MYMLTLLGQSHWIVYVSMVLYLSCDTYYMFIYGKIGLGSVYIDVGDLYIV